MLVAGAGAAGCAAALAAAQGGATVLVVEADEQFRTRCNTSRTAAMVPAGGSRWQRDAGVDDSPQRFHDDVMRKTGGTADPTATRALVDVAPALLAWLHDVVGVPLSLVTEFRYPGHSADRCHTVPDRDGATLHRHLVEALDRSAAITVRVPAALEGVRLDDDGVVTGATVEQGGVTEELDVAAVVLATNGYAADRDLVREHAPEIADGRYFGSPFSRGDALRIGRDVGADAAFLDAYQGHGSVAQPGDVLLTWATVMHGGVLVNADGRRFGDETEGYSSFGARVLDQPGGVAWMVYDERIDEAVGSFANYRELQATGAIRRADDVAGLAGLIGANVDRLSTTLDTAASAATGARQDPHGRTGWGAPLAPPYVAVRVTGALFHTQGGLRVDADAQVLRPDGSPVPGLYAAGGAAVGISGHGAGGYIAGNGLLSALGLGYLAGRAATDRTEP